MIPYARPWITEAEIAEVEACLRSGWLSTGERAARFETALAERLGVAHVVAASSGTAALHLALLASGIGPGDEVVTTPMTWVSTANVILHAGARPVFADIDPGTLNIDPAQVERVLSSRTKAVLPVHFAGQPCDEDALVGLCRARGLLLIEDAAHALGATYKGHRIGAIGDTTMFSFHPAKNLTTGEGGALATDSAEIAARARRLRFHGIEQTPENRMGGRGPASYDVVEAGFKYNFTDLQAAIGLHQLARLDEMNRRRRDLAALYDQALPSIAHVAPLATVPYEHEHAWHLMVVQLEVEALSLSRDEVIAALRERGIGAGLHFVPLHEQSLYRSFVDDPETLAAASRAGERILTLPLFPEMEARDVEVVVETLAKVVRGCTRGASATAGGGRSNPAAPAADTVNPKAERPMLERSSIGGRG